MPSLTKIRLPRALAALALAFLPLPAFAADIQNPLAAAPAPASFTGTFSNDTLSVQFSESRGAYTGTITSNGTKYPATASLTQQGLAGAFVVSGKSFDFTATLQNDRLLLVTSGTTYNLPRAIANPLAGRPEENPLAAPKPAGMSISATDAAKSSHPAGISILGATPAGQTLFLQLPSAPNLESAITQTADALAKRFDGKPSLSGAFADAQSKTHGGATFTAKIQGADARGWIFCTIDKSSPKAPATATIIIATANASPADIAPLFAFLPAPLTLKTFNFPDGSGSVDLPPGWTTQQQSLSFGANIQGPHGQSVIMGNTIIVNTPDGQMVRVREQTYQIAMQTYQMQMQTYRQSLAMHQRFPNTLMPPEPRQPVPPDPVRDMPGLIFCRLCSCPEEVLKYFYPASEQRSKNAGGPYSSLDKVIEIVPADPNPLIPGSKAGVAYIAITDHDGQKATHMRVLNRIETYPIQQGKDTWVTIFNTLRAPDATFDADLPVMNAIMSSFKLNMEVVNKQIEQNGAVVRKMGDDAERQLLKRGRDFNEQQAANFTRFETQERAREQARHDSNSDFIEYIKGVRDVYDTQTGQMHSVDLSNVNGTVNGLNALANDPNRFVQIPLRYER